MRLIISSFISLMLLLSPLFSQAVSIDKIITPQKKVKLEQPISSSLASEFKKVLFNPRKRARHYQPLARALESALKTTPDSLFIKVRLAAIYYELGLKEKKRKIRRKYMKKSDQLFYEVDAYAERMGNNVLTYEYFFLRGQSVLFYKNNISNMEFGLSYLNTSLNMIINGRINRPKSERIFIHEKLKIYYKNIKDKYGVKKQEKIIASLKSS